MRCPTRTYAFLSLFAALLASSPVLAQTPAASATPPAQKEQKPYPESVIVQSEVATADDAFSYLYLSEPIGARSNPKLIQHADPIKVHVQLIDRIIQKKMVELKDIPLSEVEVVLAIYGLGEEVAAKLVELKKAGAKVLVITDLNRSLDVDFSEGQGSSTDYNSGVFKDNETARAVKILQEGSFKIGDDLLSQPIINDRQGSMMKEIMHLKMMIVSARGKPILQTDGTGNLVNTDRVNDVALRKNQQVLEYDRAFLKRVETTFRANGVIKDIPVTPPMRVVFKDGTWIESHYTSKDVNPYRKMNELFVNPNIKVKHIWLDQFLITYLPSLEAMVQLLESDPNVMLSAKLDTSFLKNFGVGHVLGGYDAYLPYAGKVVYGVPKSVRGERVKVYVYQRPTNRPITSLTGSPDNQYVNHRKTSVIEVSEKNEKSGVWEDITYVLDGSFNMSGHVANLETLKISRFYSNSNSAIAYRQSIEQLIIHDPYVIPIDIGMLRINLAVLLHKSEFEIKADDAILFQRLMNQGDIPGVVALLNRLNDMPTLIESRPSSEILKSRIERVQKVMEWIAAQPDSKKIFQQMYSQRTVALALAASGKDGVSVQAQMKRLINQIAYRKGLTPAQLDERAAQLTKILTVENDAPAEKPAPFSSNTKPSVSKTETKTVGDDDAVETSVEKLAKKVSVSSAAKASQLKLDFTPIALTTQIGYSVFDIDDTLLHLKTFVQIYEKTTGEMKRLSTSDYAKHKGEIGISGPYEHYERRSTSFAEFSINFEKYVLEALETKHAFGPAFQEFVRQCASQESANRAFLLSARGPTVEDARNGFLQLQKKGFIKFVPPAENFFLADNPALNPTGLSVEVYKATQIKNLLNRLQAQASAMNREARLFFFDDDGRNISTTSEHILEEIQKSPGIWKNIYSILEHVTPQDWKERTIGPAGMAVDRVLTPTDLASGAGSAFDCDSELGGNGLKLKMSEPAKAQ